MPRDNHPRARQARALARKRGIRPPYDRILIVSEGEKTEPNYFNEIRRINRVPATHIRIVPSALGTEPRQIVDSAEQMFLEDRRYEWVFAVFDRDDHKTFHNALLRATALDQRYKNDERRGVRFVAVPSVPCFELWLLLHYENVQAFWHRTEVFDRLRKWIAEYAKGAQGIYQRTEPELEAATGRAQQLRKRFTAEAGDEPFTQVDELVALLRGIRAKQP